MTTEGKWEERFDSENWHAIEGANGMCACGTEKGICHKRLKSFISQEITKGKLEVLEEVEEFIKAKVIGTEGTKEARINYFFSSLRSSLKDNK